MTRRYVAIAALVAVALAGVASAGAASAGVASAGAASSGAASTGAANAQRPAQQHLPPHRLAQPTATDDDAGVSLELAA